MQLSPLLILVLMALCVSSADASLSPAALRCEMYDNPYGVDTTRPRLSWIVRSRTAVRSQYQTAYQILVASSHEILAKDRSDLWDSGRVSSSQTVHVPYEGSSPRSSQTLFWKMRVWDQDGRASPWSGVAEWTMGILQPNDWHAHWIAAPGSGPEDTGTYLLRHTFGVRRPLRRALVYVCGLGQYELSINGRKVGDSLLAPGWTGYKKTCLYDTYDVTALLHPGSNAAGLFLGNGMYHVIPGRYTKFTGSFGPLKAIAQIRLDYRDGSIETSGTDSDWRAAIGPITFSSPYGGEDYDARLEPLGWTRPDFDDSHWGPAWETEGPGGTLKGLSCSAPPLRAFGTLSPLSVKQISPGISVYDLGQNVSLMPRLAVKGPAGASLKIIPAELLNPDGTVDRSSVGGGQAYWRYTLAGTGQEIYFPHFFYHGCRYLQIECMGERDGMLPVVQSLEGIVIHSSSTPAGTFSCSNDLFNRIYTLVRWAQLSNLMSLLTDCPHRERLGWLEQCHLNGPSIRYNFDLSALMTKIMNDMADVQTPEGIIPSIAPEYVVFRDTPDGPRNAFGDSPEWGSAYVLVPWQQYQFDGDLDLLSRHYEGMKRYIAYLGSRAQEGIVDYGLGDWYDLGPEPPGYSQLTPRALTATAFYYQDLDILARTAALLGHTDEAIHTRQVADRIKAAFNRKFYNSVTGQYATGSQCANSIPLAMGLTAPEHRAAVLDAIVRDVQSRANALTAGDVGYRYLLRALAEGGRSDVIYAMNNQSDKPGYGYQLAHGATSLTEAWGADRSSSQNHFMLGQIIEWLYHDLAGIQSDPSGPGFAKIVIMPAPVGDLSRVRAEYNSIHGPIVSAWQRDGRRFTLDVTIPPNTTATVWIPARTAIAEGGRPAVQARGVKFLRLEPGATVFEVGSGHYVFTAGS